MRIKLLNACVVSCAPGVKPGDVFECEEGDALKLIAMRFAEPADRKDEVAPIETREPVELMSRPVKVRRRSDG